MFTNFDCDCFWVADRAALIRTLSVLPEYLKNKATESGAVFDYRDWQIPLGRRFRALKLWFVIRHYGIEGLRPHVREHVRLARKFADRRRGTRTVAEPSLDHDTIGREIQHPGLDVLRRAAVIDIAADQETKHYQVAVAKDAP